MAKTQATAVVRKLTGSIGDITFQEQKQNNGGIVKSKVLHNTSNTTAQQLQREKFQDAVGYAQIEMNDPVYIEAAKKNPKTSAYNMALKDYLKDPELRNAQQFIDDDDPPIDYNTVVYPPFDLSQLAGKKLLIAIKTTSPTGKADSEGVRLFQGHFNSTTGELDSLTDLPSVDFDEGPTEGFITVDVDDITGDANYTAGDVLILFPLPITNRPGHRTEYSGDHQDDNWNPDCVIRTVGDAIDYLERHI